MKFFIRLQILCAFAYASCGNKGIDSYPSSVGDGVLARPPAEKARCAIQQRQRTGATVVHEAPLLQMGRRLVHQRLVGAGRDWK